MISRRDALRRAKEGIDTLPPKCREIVILQKVDGLTDREAAETLGVSVETVRRQIKLGMKALIDHMLGGSGRILHVRNAPSPAATASLAIARELADRAQERFGLAGGPVRGT